MTETFEAGLEVDDGTGNERALSTLDFHTQRTGAAKESTLAEIKAAAETLAAAASGGTLSVEGTVALDDETLTALGTNSASLTDEELRANPVSVELADGSSLNESPFVLLSRIGTSLEPGDDTVIAGATPGRVKINFRHAGDEGRIWIGIGQAAQVGDGDFLDPGDVFYEWNAQAIHVLLDNTAVAQRVTGAEWAA